MKTGFVGVGSMGGLLVRALMRSGALDPKDVWVANRSPQRLEVLTAEFPGIRLTTNRELAGHCDLIFLCVKGSDVPTVLAQMDSELYPGQLLVTTASVIQLRALEDRVPCRIAKLIPSVTQEVGAGIALLMYGSRVTKDDRKFLEDLLGRISRPVVITESQARPAISLASGAPAFIAYLLQSMAEEAVRSNPELSSEMALGMVQETATATLRLMDKTKMTPQDVVSRVAVPGGMTALSIEILSRSVPQAWQAIFRETAEREKKDRERLTL
ncbi:MAG: NAD(P)-binding domain-containing protein [Acidobacteriia bacterium]|nr:NAD(P)-binding domain-containing protein [Terriglobia bacterium]